MLELVDKADLESVANACEFEPHYRHQNIGDYCNGSKTDFDSVSSGSNPLSPAIWRIGQAVKTPPFHGGNTGSNPVCVTINNNK